MKIKKLLSALLIASVVTLSATACGTSTPTVSTSSIPSTESAVSQSSEIQSSSSISKGGFDYDEVCQNIKIGNKSINIPFSVEDLGTDYSIKYDTAYYTKNSNNTYNVSFDIYHNSIKILDAQIHNLSKEYKEKNKNFDNIDINVYIQKNIPTNNEVLSICGISIGDDIDKVVDLFGKSHETITDNTGGSYNYYKNNLDENKSATFVYENKKIYYMIYMY